MGHWRKNQLTVFITEKCNLNCVYCYAKNTKSKKGDISIDIDFVKAGIDDFYKKNNALWLRFFGSGEPTCEFDLIKEILDYAREVTKNKLTCEIQTNGYFSNEIRDWLIENCDIIHISVDGPPEIQDAYRPTKGNGPSSSIVLSNVKYIAEKCPEKVAIRFTVTKGTLNKQKEIIRFFIKFGVKYIFSDPEFNAVGSKDKNNRISLMDYSESYIDAWKYAKQQNIYYGSFLTVNFDEHVQISCRACIPAPHLTLDGYVSCCDMVYLKNEKLIKLIYGKFDKYTKKITYDIKAIDNLRNRDVNHLSKECKSCEIIDNCAGYCLGEIYNETGSIFGRKENVCEAMKYLAQHIPCNTGILYPFFHP